MPARREPGPTGQAENPAVIADGTSCLSASPVPCVTGLILALAEGSASTVSDTTRQLTFSEWAEKKLWDLYKDHGDEVGSHYPGDRRGNRLTDCITYVHNVIEYAYERIGRKDIADAIHKLSKEGMPLADYLINIGWKGHYWNPDVKNPRDRLAEHPFSYKQALSTGNYYRVAVSGYIVNYNPTEGAQPTPKTQAAFDRFSKVRFAYGIAKGGVHTFLLSYGMVFEVHWDRIGEGLYETRPFYYFPWLSGLVLTPPDSDFSSDPPTRG